MNEARTFTGMVKKGLDKFKKACYNHNTKLKQERVTKMIKYVHVPEQNKTIAVLENTKYDAIHKIAKVMGQTKSLCFDPSKYLMSSSYRAVVVCHPDDEYDPAVGMKMAKAKLLDRYYAALDAKCDEFSKDLNAAMFEFCNRVSCTRKNRENA